MWLGKRFIASIKADDMADRQCGEPWRSWELREPWQDRQSGEPWRSWDLRGPWWDRQSGGPWQASLRGLGLNPQPGHYRENLGRISGLEALPGLDTGLEPTLG